MKKLLLALLWTASVPLALGQTAPAITTQPAPRSVTVGTDVTLTVVATGDPAPTYQWRKGGAAIPGATASVYGLPGVQPGAAGSYDVVVANAAGSVVSASVTLTVNPEVSLSAPARQVVADGGAFSLTAGVTGATSLQWFRNGLPLAGATAATLTREGAKVHGDAGWYSVEAVNSAGGAGVNAGKTVSRPVFVAVAPPRTDLLAVGINNYGQTNVPAGLTDLVAVSAGGYHGLGLRADGTVVGWGINNFGQTTIPAGLADVVAVAAGYEHSLALKADGTLVFWGQSADGQGPVPAGLTGVVAIAAGHAHNLALLRDGSVVAWGGLGVHANNQSVVPSGLGPVVAVAAGKYHSVALKADGTVAAWGLNHVGQATVPAGLGGVVAIAAGGYHTLALKADGTVVAWGFNDVGQATVPVGLTNVVAISAGLWHSMALKADGSVVSWGSNAQGERNLPPQTTAVTALAAGQEFTFVLRNPANDAKPTIVLQPVSQSVLGGETVTFLGAAEGPPSLRYQWRKAGLIIPGATQSSLTLRWVTEADGGAYELQVDNSAGSTFSATAQLVVDVSLRSAGLPPRTQMIRAGDPFTVSASATGATALQWLRNGLPIEGATGTSFSRSAADPFLDGGWYQLRASAGSKTVRSDPMFVNVARRPNALSAVGINNYGQLNVPAGLTDLVAVSAGGYHGLGLRADGTVVGWGINNFGQTTIPAGLADVVAVAAGYEHSLALKADGTVEFWGQSADGQGPVPAGVSGVVAIAAGQAHNLALLRDGSVVAWGRFGEPSFLPPTGLSGVVSIAAGKGHCVALKSDGTVVAWGGNHVGQATVPAGLGGVVAIAAGGYHTLALKADGTVVAWGFNDVGQATVPAGLTNVVAVSAGLWHSLALKADGTVVGWGGNLQGERNLPPQTTAVTALAAGQEFTLVLSASAAGALTPAILSAPRAATVVAGQPFGFSVIASGSAPLAFQWRKAGVPLPGATDALYGLPAAQPGDAGTYDVVVTNAAGSVTSAGAALTVKLPQTISFPEITGKSFGDAPFALGASASSGLPVAFQVVSGPAALTGGVLTLTGAGEVTVRAAQAGDAGFAAAPDVSRTFSVAKGVPVLTWATPAPIVQGTALGASQLNAASLVAGTFSYVPAAGTVLPVGQHPLEALFTPAFPANYQSATATVTLQVVAPTAPSITTQPQPQVLAAPGGGATFSVVANGSSPLTYQWARNGVSIAGATNATLTLANVQPAAVGSYAVTVTNAAGSVRSAGAALEIRQAGQAAAHLAPLRGYVPGQVLLVTSTLTYSGTPSALSWSLLLPSGWSYGAAVGGGALVAPVAGQMEVLDWAWSEIPASPLTFSFTVNVPAGQTAGVELVALAGVRGGVTQQFLAQPDPLALNRLVTHLADTDRNFRIGLLELTRVIELFNVRNGAVRTGAYGLATTLTEDGFQTAPERAAGATANPGLYHSADSDRDGRIGLLELTRVIELYNWRGSGPRTGDYKAKSGTEDGFDPGP